jgi:hypothetical protein
MSARRPYTTSVKNTVVSRHSGDSFMRQPPREAALGLELGETPVGRVNETERSPMTQTTVRYFVTDVDEAVDFYCNRLGFHVELPPAPDSPVWRRMTCDCFSTSRAQAARARPVACRSLEAGIGSRSSLPISTRALKISLPRARGSVVKSSKGLAAARS